MEKIRVQVNGRGYYLKTDEPEKILKIAKEFENQILYIVSKMQGITEAEATALSALLIMGESLKQQTDSEAAADREAVIVEQREKLAEAELISENLKNEIEELKRIIDEKSEKLAECEKTEAELRARIEGAQTSDDVLKVQLEQAQEEIQRLNSVIDDNKRAYEELENKNSEEFTGLLEQEVSAVRESENSLKLKLEEEINKNRLLSDELAFAKENESKIKEEFEQLKTASEELLNDLAAEEKHKHMDKADIDNETEEFYKNELLAAKETEVALMDELNAAKEREIGLTAQVNKAENTANEAKAALCSANKLIAQLNSEKLSQVANIESLRQECDVARQKLEAANRTVAELNGKLTEINIKNSVNNDSESSTLEVKELRMKNEDLLIELEIANEMIEEYKKKNNEAITDEERRKYEKMISDYKKEIESIKSGSGEIDKLRGVLVETEQAIRQKCEEKEEENRKLRSILNNYENSYQICVNQKEEEIRNLQKQLQQLMEKYNEKDSDELDGDFVQPTFES